MARPECKKTDAFVYFTLWPILAFSFFVAVDEIVDSEDYVLSETPAILMAPQLVFVTLTHMFAFFTLIIGMVESLLTYSSRPTQLCTRPLFLEINTSIAAASLFFVTFVDCFLGTIESETLLGQHHARLCKILPWSFASLVGVVQILWIVFRGGETASGEGVGGGGGGDQETTAATRRGRPDRRQVVR